MFTLLKTVVRDDKGSSMITFGLLAAVIGFAYYLNTGAVRCHCFKTDISTLVALDSVERLFGTMLAAL